MKRRGKTGAGVLAVMLATGLLAGCSPSADTADTVERLLTNRGLQEDAAADTAVSEASETSEEPAETLSDTVRWFNASYAILTELNGWDYNRYGGGRAYRDQCGS